MKATPAQLTGRTASCGRGCGRTHPSPELVDDGFFEYLGPGSRHATENCGICHYHEVAHEKAQTGARHLTQLLDHEFIPAGGRETDRYWCGCGNTD